jgi:hypothetical protein
MILYTLNNIYFSLFRYCSLNLIFTKNFSTFLRYHLIVWSQMFFFSSTQIRALFKTFFINIYFYFVFSQKIIIENSVVRVLINIIVHIIFVSFIRNHMRASQNRRHVEESFDIKSFRIFKYFLCVSSPLTSARGVVWLRQYAELMRWVVFIQCLARCYISVFIIVDHVIALATLSVSTLESLWKVENHRFLINFLKLLILLIYLNISLCQLICRLICRLFDNLIDCLFSRCSLDSLDNV